MKTSDAIIAVRFEARIWRDSYAGTDFNDKPTTYPAEWGVYDIENDVRIDYADSKEDAENKVERWNAGKIPAAVTAKVESISDLRKLLKPGHTVKTILRHCSRSGMSRRISLVVARDNDVVDITWDAARAMGDPVKQGGKYVQDAGLVVGGCGMDMGFHIVYSLSRTLFPDGFGIPGTNGMIKDMRPSTKEKAEQAVKCGYKFNGRNGDKTGWDTDGGYALRQAWL